MEKPEFCEYLDRKEIAAWNAFYAEFQRETGEEFVVFIVPVALQDRVVRALELDD